MGDILVTVAHVFFEFGNNDVLQSASVKATSVFLDNLGRAELHVRDLVSTCFDEGRHDMLSDMVFT
jgi:hypothetical protein